MYCVVQKYLKSQKIRNKAWERGVYTVQQMLMKILS